MSQIIMESVMEEYAYPGEVYQARRESDVDRGEPCEYPINHMVGMKITDVRPCIDEPTDGIDIIAVDEEGREWCLTVNAVNYSRKYTAKPVLSAYIAQLVD